MKILYKDKNLIAIDKEIGMPSQSDPTGDADVMTLLSDRLREMNEPSDLWLVHRLDRVVGGAIVFARNKKYAARLSELASGAGMGKEYLAVAEGIAEGGEMRDFLYKDAAKSKAFVVDRKRAGVKEAFLEYRPIECVEVQGSYRTLVRVKLHTGRFHQIRAQFSTRKMPLVGDGKYGSRDSGARTPALYSARLAFSVDGRKYEISAMPDRSKYPWSLFSEQAYSQFNLPFGGMESK